MLKDNIMQLLVDYDIPKASLARIAGVSSSAVAKWLAGGNIRQEQLDKIKAHFCLSDDDLLSTKYGLYAKAHGAVHDEDITFSNPIFSKDITGECKDLTLVDHSIHIPQEIADKHKNGFALQVVSDCMSKVLPQGAVIIVDRSIEASNGSIVVAQKEDKTVLLRRYSCGTSTVLLSADSYSVYDDVVCKKDDVRIIGVVVWAQPPKEFC